jgi:hypothetical protein
MEYKMKKLIYSISVSLSYASAAVVFYFTSDIEASSHREAPIISTDPVADNTDVYAFVAPDATNALTIVASFNPFEEPAGGPNFNKFGTDVTYEIKIDNVGDRLEHIVYQFQFTDVVGNAVTHSSIQYRFCYFYKRP